MLSSVRSLSPAKLRSQAAVTLSPSDAPSASNAARRRSRVVMLSSRVQRLSSPVHRSRSASPRHQGRRVVGRLGLGKVSERRCREHRPALLGQRRTVRKRDGHGLLYGLDRWQHPLKEQTGGDWSPAFACSTSFLTMSGRCSAMSDRSLAMAPEPGGLPAGLPDSPGFQRPGMSLSICYSPAQTGSGFMKPGQRWSVWGSSRPPAPRLRFRRSGSASVCQGESTPRTCVGRLRPGRAASSARRDVRPAARPSPSV